MPTPDASQQPESVRRTHEAAALAVLIAVFVLAYAHLWSRGEIPYSRHSDVVVYNLSVLQVLHDSLVEGRGLPFWRSDQLVGYPALSNPQATYLYPPVLALAWLPPARAVGILFALHFAIAGLGGYWLARELRLGLSARVFLALGCAFQVKLILATYAGWLPVVPVISWLPGLLAAWIGALRRPGIGPLLAVAATGALALSAGSPQLVFYLVLVCLPAVAAEAIHGWARGARQALAGPLRLAAGGVLAVGVAAVVWLPLAGDAPLLSRADTSYEFLLGERGLPPARLLTLFHPEILGTPLDDSYAGVELWEDLAYFGIVPLAYAVAGLVFGWRRRDVRLVAAGFALALLLSSDTPILRGLHALVPGFDLFRLPGRFLFVASLLGISLGALGVDELSRRGPSGLGRLARLVLPLALFAMLAEGLYYVDRYLDTAPVAEVVPETDYARLFADDPDLFRVAPIGRATLNYGWAAHSGLSLVSGIDPFNLSHYVAYFDLLRIGRSLGGVRVWNDLDTVRRLDMLAALNVKYLVAPAPLGLPEDIARLVRKLADQPEFVLYRGLGRVDLYVYELVDRLARVFWVEAAVGAADESHLFSLLSRLDLRKAAAVLDPSLTVQHFTAGADERLRVVAAAPGRLEFEAQAETRRFAVVSEIWHPGWKARIDGQPAPILRADGALMGLWIPEGVHEVVLSFRPLYWSTARGITLASAFVFATLLIVAIRAAR